MTIRHRKQRLGRQGQRGMMLIMLVFIIGLAMMAYLIHALDANAMKIERDKKTAVALAEAKAALTGYAIGSIGEGQRPGDLMRPDYFGGTEFPPNFDGLSDSGCMDFSKANGLPMISTGQNMRCLGRLPWKDLTMKIDSPSENDPEGRMPWYAVSANLVDSACLATLNSDALNLVYAGYVCSGVSLPHPWLTVRDKLGNVLSNRVAAIVLIPGPPIGNQSRAQPPNLGGANQYLDSITVTNSVECGAPHVPGTYTNAGLNNEFILGDDTKTVSESDPCFQHPYQFNDRLIYITIDELMAEVEKRVVGEVRKNLLAYKASYSAFPDAASIGYQGQSCVLNSSSGFLPIPTCRCTGSMCDCAFPGVMKFTSTNNYSAQNGSCSYLAKVCTCTGAGSCIRTSSPARSFICTRTGTCTSNITGPFEYTPSPPVDSSSMFGSGGCTIGGVTANCASAGTVTIPGATACTSPLLAIEDTTHWPAWFSENGWKHLIYYSKGNLTVGTKTNVTALLISSGQALGTQPHPSANLADYLDSLENTDGNSTYDAVGTRRTNTYNDQMFIVAP